MNKNFKLIATLGSGLTFITSGNVNAGWWEKLTPKTKERLLSIKKAFTNNCDDGDNTTEQKQSISKDERDKFYYMALWKRQSTFRLR